ncbi:MAG: VCBS repeat-containing protein [Gemmataceae bacterium]|nr:VCBS repeat-containing protein [Gemmataceae bacterium]
MSAKAGVAGPFQYGHGAAAFDADNDGWPDLLLTGYNRLVLLHNEPDGAGGRRFVDVTAKSGLATDNLWSTSAGWGDLDGDGYPDLYVAHYADWGFDTNHPPFCTYDGKTRDVCQPRLFKPLPHAVYRNNRDGTFTDITKSLKLRTDGKGIGVLVVDVDGKPDVYAANDTDDNFLYLNKTPPGGPITLEEVGLVAGVARDDRGAANGSMGVDAADFDRTGRPSVIVTNSEGELPALYQNRTAAGGPPRFLYATPSAGVAAVGGVYVGWGAAFADHDLDGWEDLFLVNGHAIRFPSKLDRRQKPLLLRNDGGRFTNITRAGGGYFTAPHNARGLAAGDLDNDGRVDLVVSHLNEPAAVLRNVSPTDGRHWVGLELVGAKNRDVVGARVVVESAGGKQTRFAKGGGSYASTPDRRPVVGLGGRRGEGGHGVLAVGEVRDVRRGRSGRVLAAERGDREGGAHEASAGWSSA